MGVGATVDCVTILDGGITGGPPVEGVGECRADSMRQVRKRGINQYKRIFHRSEGGDGGDC